MPVKTKVPAFWHYCPNMINGLQCAKPHNVLIFQHRESIKCRSCGFVSKIDIRLPPKHPHEKYIRFINSHADDKRYIELITSIS